MTQEQKKIFGYALNQARGKLNVTQIKCAQHCGVSIVSYQNWERGICEPKEDKMKLICEFLGLHKEDFE